MGKAHLSSLKFKVASQVGVNLTDNYNGDITTRQAGLIGGNMVRELIATAEQNLSTTYPTSYDNRSWTDTSITNYNTTNNQAWF